MYLYGRAKKETGMHKQFDQLPLTVNLRTVCHLCNLLWSSHPLIVNDDDIDDDDDDDNEEGEDDGNDHNDNRRGS